MQAWAHVRTCHRRRGAQRPRSKQDETQVLMQRQFHCAAAGRCEGPLDRALGRVGSIVLMTGADHTAVLRLSRRSAGGPPRMFARSRDRARCLCTYHQLLAQAQSGC